MYIYLSLSYAKTHRYNEGLYKTYPQGIYRCHVLDRIRSLRSFYASKNKASSKRLSTIYVSPFQPPFLQGLRHGDKAKIKKKRKSGLKRMKKIPFTKTKTTSAERKINLSRTIFQSQPNDFSFGAEIFSVLLRQILCCYLVENQRYRRWSVFLLFMALDERKKIDTDSTPVHRL